MPEPAAMRGRVLTGLTMLMLPAASAAQVVQLNPGQLAPVGSDGRVLGHLPYSQIDASQLVSAPAGFGVGQPCKVQRDVLLDLMRLLSAADQAPGLPHQLHAVSCFRTIPHQAAVFCGRGRHGCQAAAVRAREVGPPGYSEHATGYAIDFAVRPQRGCRDVDACIASTPAGAWLLANAPRFGFELSFPSGNAQGVTWEPWHWRWVGVTDRVPGAATARALFARARAQFPASPAVLGFVVQVSQPAPPLALPPPRPPAQLIREERQADKQRLKAERKRQREEERARRRAAEAYY